MKVMFYKYTQARGVQDSPSTGRRGNGTVSFEIDEQVGKQITQLVLKASSKMKQ